MASENTTLSSLSALPVRNVHNRAYHHEAGYGAALTPIISRASCDAAWAVITRWPGYVRTPFYTLNGLAKAAGLKQIWYKHEAPRFGLGSFKGLGGPYSIYRLLERIIKAKKSIPVVPEKDLLEGKYRDITSSVTVTTATDGNHGRGVAWGAKLFGCKCVVYIHAGVSEGRKKAIESYGAEVIRISGNYDDSVMQAQADAEKFGRYVISDTSYPGYMDLPKYVMQGYGVMVQEALDALPLATIPTHVFVQGGVGALPAAICAYLWQYYGKQRPHFIVVEPDRADCLYQSAMAGEPRKALGDLNTIMAGLACGEVSLLAWEILKDGAENFITIPDEAAMETMRLLAQGTGGDAKIVAGESAVGGLAGALCARAQHPIAEALKLDENSTLLVFGTEGATDSVIYEKIVGMPPEAVK